MRQPNFTAKRISLVLLPLVILVSACSPAATPEVIQDNSAAMTRTAAVFTPTPNGPTPTASMTPTPYTRPTDDPALALDTPIVRVGNETITLRQFRQRVRYERFIALDNARTAVENVGLQKLVANANSSNQMYNALMDALTTLADYKSYGEQIYSNMVRESIIRQEFNARQLKVDPAAIDGYWIRQLDLQTDPNVATDLPKAKSGYIAKLMNYSGMSADAIDQIVMAKAQNQVLYPIIAKENVKPPSGLTYKLRHILTKTEQDANAAIAAYKAGGDFRMLACQYSIDPATKGAGGELGFKSSASFVPGLQNTSAVFSASVGDIVGPIQSQTGWYLFRLKDTRKNADGDTEVNAQALVVASKDIADSLKARAQKGEDFGVLACSYSLDSSNSGNGGDLGYVDPRNLPDNVVSAIKASENGVNFAATQAATAQATPNSAILGPFDTAQGYEVMLVEDRKVTIPNPGDLEKAQQDAYNLWQLRRAASNDVTVLSSAWENAIPADPQPGDVSPLLSDSVFKVATPTAATPTPAGTAAH